MIIQTPYTVNDTITIKTTAGEEVISRFISEDANTITVQKPLSIMSNGQGIGLGPFSYTINPDSKVKLNKGGILFIHKTDSEMAKQYVQSTSGIAV